MFRSQAAKDLGDKEFIESVWPTVDAANRVAESFSQIGKDMIMPMPAGASIPLTDKGRIIRAQVYNAKKRNAWECIPCFFMFGKHKPRKCILNAREDVCEFCDLKGHHAGACGARFFNA